MGFCSVRSYALFGARVAGIFHDITLDGPVFRSFDTGVEKENLVGEVYAGFGVRRRDWELGYVHTYRSKEFKTQNAINELKKDLRSLFKV